MDETPTLLRDRIAVVSGIGPGLGRDIALVFAREGAKLVLSARTESTLRSVAAEVEARGGEALAVTADVTRREDCGRLVAAARKRFGRIDVLSNNAYVAGKMAPAEELTIDDWRAPLEVNLFGNLQLTMEVVPLMKEQGGGSIVMTNSMIVRRVLPTMAAYAASKAALLTATQALARELGRYRIRLNSVLPGYIWGDTLRAYFEAQAQEEGVDPRAVYDRVAAEIALGRIPDSSEVAEAVLFFASDLSRAITGQSLDVNGGHVFV
jgi:NAD(P)-dependent dehydrogenase (short-subunit alcohol dehydrogenase family)